ncbi:hypothetical protein GY45DRAFT_741306 [Cubamyces sp. BRFM 1775]|nr:hypothetical protein GY45DRAFT_741306 [Cubamyces sp. BRFM 1775]
MRIGYCTSRLASSRPWKRLCEAGAVPLLHGYLIAKACCTALGLCYTPQSQMMFRDQDSSRRNDIVAMHLPRSDSGVLGLVNHSNSTSSGQDSPVSPAILALIIAVSLVYFVSAGLLLLRRFRRNRATCPLDVSSAEWRPALVDIHVRTTEADRQEPASWANLMPINAGKVPTASCAPRYITTTPKGPLYACQPSTHATRAIAPRLLKKTVHPQSKPGEMLQVAVFIAMPSADTAKHHGELPALHLGVVDAWCTSPRSECQNIIHPA